MRRGTSNSADKTILDLHWLGRRCPSGGADPGRDRADLRLDRTHGMIVSRGQTRNSYSTCLTGTIRLRRPRWPSASRHWPPGRRIREPRPLGPGGGRAWIQWGASCSVCAIRRWSHRGAPNVVAPRTSVGEATPGRAICPHDGGRVPRLTRRWTPARCWRPADRQTCSTNGGGPKVMFFTAQGIPGFSVPHHQRQRRRLLLHRWRHVQYLGRLPLHALRHGWGGRGHPRRRKPRQHRYEVRGLFRGGVLCDLGRGLAARFDVRDFVYNADNLGRGSIQALELPKDFDETIHDVSVTGGLSFYF